MTIAFVGAKYVIADLGELRQLLQTAPAKVTERENVFSYQNDAGFLQTAVCESNLGSIPGKSDGASCWFSWEEKEYYVKGQENFTIVNGKMELPSKNLKDCESVGTQKNDSKKYYSALINGVHGFVPGKYEPTENKASYPWGGVEYSTTDMNKVLIVCK